MSGGYFDYRDQLLTDFGNKLKCEKLPALRLLGQHLKEIADVLYAVDMHLSCDSHMTDEQITDLVYSVTNSKTVQKFYKDEAEQLEHLAEGLNKLSDRLKDNA